MRIAPTYAGSGQQFCGSIAVKAEALRQGVLWFRRTYCHSCPAVDCYDCIWDGPSAIHGFCRSYRLCVDRLCLSANFLTGGLAKDKGSSGPLSPAGGGWAGDRNSHVRRSLCNVIRRCGCRNARMSCSPRQPLRSAQEQGNHRFTTRFKQQRLQRPFDLPQPKSGHS